MISWWAIVCHRPISFRKVFTAITAFSRTQWKKEPKKMQFERGLDKFIKLFYICGLSCYPSFDEYLTVKTKKERFVQYFPSVALIGLIIILLTTICMYNFLSNDLVIRRYMIHMILMLLILFLCAIQTIRQWRNFAKICMHMRIIESLSWGKFYCVSNAFKRHFMRRVFVMLIPFLTAYVARISKKQMPSLPYVVIIAILDGLILLVLLHAFFYVDLLDHMLESFVRHVDTRASTATAVVEKKMNNFHSPAAYQLTAELFHFKLLHFHLWEISETINQLFGWTIIIIFLRYFFYSIWNVYDAYSSLFRQPPYFFGLFRKWLSTAVDKFV